MEYNDIAELIIMFSLGWFIGNQILLWRMRRHIMKIADKLGLDIEEACDEEDETVPPLCITEKQGNQLYLYDKKTNAFYCQAPTLEELAEAMANHRKIDLAFVVHDQQKFWFVNGKIEPAVANES
jgi:hypothetical protein